MEGQNVRCCHCDGTGTMDGPGGPEECCHCRGKGERWFDSEADADVARADLNDEARRVDPDLDIGGGHAGMPDPSPLSLWDYSLCVGGFVIGLSVGFAGGLVLCVAFRVLFGEAVR